MEFMQEAWRARRESRLTGAIVGNGAAGMRRIERSASRQGQQALGSDASSRAGDAVAVLAPA